MFSIVIPTYGIKGVSLVDDLLDSISKFDNPNLDEIVISDDGSNIDTILGLDSIKEKYTNIFDIKLIYNDHYHSFSKTVNKGIMAANINNDILLLNNDMSALTSFEPFTEFIRQNKESNIGIIGAKLLYPNMRIQHSGITRMKLAIAFRHVYRHRERDYPPANFPKKYLAVTGACQYINRELIDKIGYLDENYILSYEDVDYCVRAQLNRYDVWYIPYVTMIHHELTTRTREHDIDNYRRFWRKWGKLYRIIDPTIQNDYSELGIVILGAIGFSYLMLKSSKSNLNKNQLVKI